MAAAEDMGRQMAERDRLSGRLTALRYVATLDIPLGSSIMADDTFGNRHHWTLLEFETSQYLLSCVKPPQRPL
jgi:hypothetical protein